MELPDFVLRHHPPLMQRSCSESLQTLRRARKVLSAPKMSGPFLVSQNPRMSPMPCVGKILRAWKSRITLFNKVRAERKEDVLYFAIYGYEKKIQKVSWGECCFSGEKGMKNESHEEKNAGPSFALHQNHWPGTTSSLPSHRKYKTSPILLLKIQKSSTMGFFLEPCNKTIQCYSF